MHCAICGEEQDLTGACRFWDPDDGWRFGRFCPSCAKTEKNRKPRPDDYAWEIRGEFVSDHEEAIDAIYG